MTIDNILNHLTKQLCFFIKDTFSQEDKYFHKYILPSLSFKQKQTNPKKIEDLDLASLIRVINNNRWEIEKITEINFPQEYKNYCFEMTAIRNKYAHKTAIKINNDDKIRDLDTINRFIEPLSIEESIKNDVLNLKNKFREKIVTPKVEKLGKESYFSPGQEVRIKSDPNIKAVIMEILPSEQEEKYKVFVGDTFKEYYKSQLEPLEKEDVEELNVKDLKYLLSSILINQSDLSSLYSLNAGKIDFIPYQFRPVFKIINSDKPRMLIADSVGVGKTIEAGLILKELQARHSIESVLIICPKALVSEKKWRYEMRKFDEKFIALDRKLLRYCVRETDLEGEWTGNGNIDANPQFINPSQNNYHLSASSPCIDAGNPDPQYNDPDGSRNDMGAYGGPGGDW